MPPATKKAAAAPAKSLDALYDKMTKTYGAGRIVRRSQVTPYDVVSTGSIELDNATVVGGIVLGRITEFAGVEGSCKTTTAINVMANAQKKYGKATGLIDMEQTFDWDWAEANGLDTSDQAFFYALPDNSEDVSDQVKAMIETGFFSVIVIDSIGGMESKKAFDKEAEEHVMGRNAQVITRMTKRLAVLAKRHNVAVIVVNQFRANLANPMGADVTAGPKALKYATTMRIDFRQVFADRLMAQVPGIKEPQEVGVKVAARIPRSKVGPHGRSGSFFLITQPTPEHGPIGIDQATEAYNIGIEAGLIKAEGGGYHRFPWTEADKDRVRSQQAAKIFLREHPERIAQIRDMALEQIKDQIIYDVEGDFKVNEETGEVVG